MPNNLASYFASHSNKSNNNSGNRVPIPYTRSKSNTTHYQSISSKNHELLQKNNMQIPDEDEDMGPSVSMAVQADNDDEFHKKTFNLKRTRSLGYLHDSKSNLNNISDSSDDDEDYTTHANTTMNRNPTAHPNIPFQLFKNNHSFTPTPSPSPSLSSSSSSSRSPSVSSPGVPIQRLNSDSYIPSASTSPPPADNDTLLIPQDDNDVVREPERHVDYLSHHWNEYEISNSWKYIVLKKKKRNVQDEVNSARLENASWRTWAKARNNLQTVSPEIVNWSKDSDVTWLYGPVVTDDQLELHHTSSEKNISNTTTSTSMELLYGADDKRLQKNKSNANTNPNVKLKPILKKRTVTEIIEENALWKLNEARKHFNEMRHTTVVMDPNGPAKDPHEDYNFLAGKINAQYYSPITKNNTQDQIVLQDVIPTTAPKLSTPSSYTNLRSVASAAALLEGNNDNLFQTTNINNNVPIMNFMNPKRSTTPTNDNDINAAATTTTTTTTIQTTNDNDKSAITPSSIRNDSNIANSNSNSNNNLNSNLNNTTNTNNNNNNNYNNPNSNDNDNTNTPDEPILPSILTTSSNNNNNNVHNESIALSKDRHIHFNDRVEQCEAVKYSSSDTLSQLNSSSSIDSLNNYSNNNDSYFTLPKKHNNNSMQTHQSSSSSDDDDDDQDDEDSGLFINARFSRRFDSSIHSPLTDNTSTTSSRSANNPTGNNLITQLHPIIKLLPATTLNYGSDEESDSDYSGYRNAESHNVNTYRGYDYMYDYNSVYTGDTSSFLPMDHSGIIDIPEGIDLQHTMRNDSIASNYSNYDNSLTNTPILSNSNQLLTNNNNTNNNNSNTLSNDAVTTPQANLPISNRSFTFMDSDEDTDMSTPSDLEDESGSYSGSEGNQQFIEHSQEQSSDDDSDDEADGYNNNMGLGLKRTVSLGKSMGNNSLKDLTQSVSVASFTDNSRTHSFITGKLLNSPITNPTTATTNDKYNISHSNLNSLAGSIPTRSSPLVSTVKKTIRKPIVPKRTVSSSSFIFASDSEDEDDEDEDDNENKSNDGLVKETINNTNTNGGQLMGSIKDTIGFIDNNEDLMSNSISVSYSSIHKDLLSRSSQNLTQGMTSDNFLLPSHTPNSTPISSLNNSTISKGLYSTNGKTDSDIHKK
ncbi:hypothetical protein TBLA_0G03070 [Henningerozyma blattae CBS 6284]|uniref:Nitrogen regulatory protein areA GATA-like domain-containing protein n=1 Tax=Henningerozyma blattae (strain ATCC 34711 / CBS 6284 / DSM 70876 / NBRC 10599 / NRRL Y-10934 / UCD 77-7) TaxID=1071380 RepID=I2H792_HENB6|nr:hypothetical protein TBLA_0G03070 [Tetrapisispora blattae CBS 6284]CCH62244.1 hypothetical protein TBLA_0G03070 [Tetrapisispora blattae CBS 6284]